MRVVSITVAVLLAGGAGFVLGSNTGSDEPTTEETFEVIERSIRAEAPAMQASAFTVFLKQGVTRAQAATLVARFRRVDAVVGVEFASKQDAIEIVADRLGQKYPRARRGRNLLPELVVATPELVVVTTDGLVDADESLEALTSAAGRAARLVEEIQASGFARD